MASPRSLLRAALALLLGVQCFCGNELVHGAATAVPTVQTTGLPGQWQYVGCLEEPAPNRVFPYQIINTNNNSATA
ncbi:hypothetical protein PHLGIDRAFT_118353, partial [Phlebiopsis gigantea 11061_1 CR5-6]